MRLLLVEDDVEVSAMLTSALRLAGHVVDHVATGADALWRAGEQGYDSVILDVGLPDTTGFEVCRALRDTGSSTPVLMLTGRQEVSDRVAGLDAGADDYLAKPFSLDELKARLRALGRRSEREIVLLLVAGDVEVEPASRTVRRQGQVVPLVGREYTLVEVLARSAGRVVSRETVVEQLWDFSTDVSANALDVLVSSVRHKLDRPFGSPALHTVRGSGYMLAASSPQR
jgi:two-component system OmpR family response regulator